MAGKQLPTARGSHVRPLDDLVVLVGNGLSIATNPDLRLDALTKAFLERHGDDREDLDLLLAEVNLGA